MKKSLTLATLLLVGTSVAAMDVDYFVSVGGGNAAYGVKAKASRTVLNQSDSKSITQSDNEAYFSIQGGTILDKTHKIGLDYTHYNTQSGTSMYSVGLGYDYLFNISGSKFKPFIGASYSINKNSSDTNGDERLLFGNSVDLTTNIVSARVGVQYDIDENFFILASYDHGFIFSGDESKSGIFNYNNTMINYSVKFEVEKINKTGIYVGYKF